MLSELFTEIQDQIGQEFRVDHCCLMDPSDSEDLQKFQSIRNVSTHIILTPMRAFSKGAPHHFPKAHALRGKWTLSGFVRSRLESLWWFEVDFWPRSVHFRRGPPTIFRKHMPSGMGTESLGMIGCIFAENGPLEGGIESSFWGTGWGAKGDFRRIFGPDPFIFEGGPPPFSESTCPQVWAQKVWEWLDVYSRRMGP